MSVHLTDKSKASTRWINGQCRITFHNLNNKVITLPVGVEVTIGLIEKLYNAYKH